MKKMKLNLILALSFLFLAVFLTSCKKNEIYSEGLSNADGEKNIADEEGIVGDKLPVTRAVAAKMISMYFYNENQINNFDRVINFDDVEENQWYDKYVNAAFKGGLISGADEKNFKPNDFLTLSQAQVLIDKMDSNNKVKIKLTEENKDKAISLALWNELYIKVLENKGYGEIKKERIILAASNAQSKNIKEGFVITDMGLYYAEGIRFEDIIGDEIEAIIRDKNILSVNEITKINPIIKNVFVTDISENNIEVFIGGMKRKFILSDDISADIKKGDICSIKINGNKIDDLNIITDKINSKICMGDDEKIELEATGDIFYEKEFKVYSYDGENVKLRDISSLISGESYEFYINAGRLGAAVIDENDKNDKIRVLLNNNENKNINSMVNISSDGDFYIITGRDEKEFKADEEVIIEKDKNEDLFSKKRIIIKTKDDNSMIFIKSIKSQNDDFLKVKGDVEIRKEDNGYIVVNEVSAENYVLGILNGIDTDNLSDETVKMLSVILRSKAYKQKSENKLLNFGANVDRTGNYQLYKPQILNDKNKKAVESTKNLCLTYEDNCIIANYFSQDCGSSAVMGEVWFDSKKLTYPFDSGVYNKSVVFLNGNYGDLSKDDNFKRFIDNAKNDLNSEWFRWNFNMNSTELDACINTSIKWLYNDYPNFVKCLDKSGKFISKEVEDVGEIRDIEILKRGKGGNAMEIKITGSKEIVVLRSDTLIRKIIKPKQFFYGRNPIKLNKIDGSSEEDLSVMPSSFFYINVNKDDNGKLIDVEFKGGGYGHGVGISLNRAEYLAKDGKGFEEIIKYFYPGTTIKSI